MVDLWRWPTLTAAAASIVAPNGTTPSNHGRLLLEIRTPIAIEVEMWQIMANGCTWHQSKSFCFQMYVKDNDSNGLIMPETMYIPSSPQLAVGVPLYISSH